MASAPPLDGESRCCSFQHGRQSGEVCASRLSFNAKQVVKARSILGSLLKSAQIRNEIGTISIASQ